MSQQLLGETFDIHGGGLDLVFPHHEKEIARASVDGGPWSVWMHNGLMKASTAAGKVGGRTERDRQADDVEGKISRSKGGGLASFFAARGASGFAFSC